MGDDQGHETDDVDGSCFVSKSPARNPDGMCSASRVPPHDFSSSTYLTLSLFFNSPSLFSPSIALRPKTCAKSIARQGGQPLQGFARTDLSTAIPHSPTRRDDHGSLEIRK